MTEKRALCYDCGFLRTILQWAKGEIPLDEVEPPKCGMARGILGLP